VSKAPKGKKKRQGEKVPQELGKNIERMNGLKKCGRSRGEKKEKRPLSKGKKNTIKNDSDRELQEPNYCRKSTYDKPADRKTNMKNAVRRAKAGQRRRKRNIKKKSNIKKGTRRGEAGEKFWKDLKENRERALLHKAKKKTVQKEENRGTSALKFEQTARGCGRGEKKKQLDHKGQSSSRSKKKNSAEGRVKSHQNTKGSASMLGGQKRGVLAKELVKKGGEGTSRFNQGGEKGEAMFGENETKR